MIFPLERNANNCIHLYRSLKRMIAFQAVPGASHPYCRQQALCIWKSFPSMCSSSVYQCSALTEILAAV